MNGEAFDFNKVVEFDENDLSAVSDSGSLFSISGLSEGALPPFLTFINGHNAIFYNLEDSCELCEFHIHFKERNKGKAVGSFSGNMEGDGGKHHRFAGNFLITKNLSQ